MKHPLTLAGLFWICLALAQAQTAYTLLLKSGDKLPAENGAAFIANPSVSPSEVFEGRYARVLQFYTLPDEQLQAELKAAGITLHEYMPNFAYLATLPAGRSDLRLLGQAGLRAAMAWEGVDKLHPFLVTGPAPDWALEGDYVNLQLQYFPGFSQAGFEQALTAMGIELIYHSTYDTWAEVLAPLSALPALSMQPWLIYAEPADPPATPDDLRGQTLHRSNLLNSNSTGLAFDGTGIRVLVRDDGLVGPHIDYQGRLNNLSNDASGTHGDGVAGIIAGAGNLDPDNQGMAPGATVYAIDYQAAFTDNTLQLHQVDSVMITNSSYSNGCNAGYTTNARRIDEQMFDNPSLMHVFSAGNSNGSNCNYGAGSQYGNITGGHKSAKNCFTVANVDAADVIDPSSSRGPVQDGRLKPDIAANGRNQISTDPDNAYQVFGGTSAAAPSIAGCATQLYHAFRTMNGNQYPPAGFIKAAMMNTADDLGRPGPDYTFGYGRVNAFRAYKTLEERTYLTGGLSNNGNNTHTIRVPEGVGEFRVMLYWVDRPGSTTVRPVLVNDLDLKVTDPSLAEHLPLILRYEPDTTLLRAFAAPGRDSMNNTEQVVLRNPATGEYIINVNGRRVAQGPQQYFLVWTFVRPGLKVVYPLGGESMTPNSTERLRWDALGGTGAFTLEYSLDSGQNWTFIRTVATRSQRFADWVVPEAVSAKALFRVTQDTFVSVSQPFSILARPVVTVKRVCQDGVVLSWQPVVGATEYDVYTLGNKYMDIVGSTTADTFKVFGLSHLDRHWFSVRARGPEGLSSRRLVAFRNTPGLQNCNPVAVIPGMNVPAVACVNDVVTLTDQSSNYPTGWQWNITPAGTFIFTGGTSGISRNPLVRFLQPGTYRIILIASNEAGSVALARSVTVYARPTATFNHLTDGLDITFTNSSANANGYLWSFGDGNTSNLANPTHSYPAAGDYTVTLTVYGDCDTVSITRTLQAWPTNLQEVLDGASISCTPNPSNGLFTLSLKGTLDKQAKGYISDLQGRVLQRFVLPAQREGYQQNLDLRHLSAGLYMLHLEQAGRRGAMKLLIQ